MVALSLLLDIFITVQCTDLRGAGHRASESSGLTEI